MMAVFFAFCSIVGFFNVYRLLRDKMVCGVSLFPSVVYGSTNAFEVYYFAKLGDWHSAVMASLMCASTISWLLLAMLYKERARRAAAWDRMAWLQPID